MKNFIMGKSQSAVAEHVLFECFFIVVCPVISVLLIVLCNRGRQLF